MAPTSYRDAGVDTEAGDTLVERIKPFVERTRIREVVGGVGGFAGLCGLPADIVDPVLVSGTDGVGTKLKLAIESGRNDTVGIDLVAMCVNDVITTGARPLFFLDYFATSRLDVEQATDVIRGIARGCELAGCALLGGETAELPGFYAQCDYDLAGFCVGVVSRAKIVDGRAVEPGDAVIAVASSGLHSNGYSLARKVLLDDGRLALSATPEELGEPLLDVLLRPTRIYAAAVSRLVSALTPRAIAHITGGGLGGNVPRVIPEGLGVRLDTESWSPAPIFGLIAARGDVSVDEMRRTFNMGVGLVVVVAPGDVTAALDALRAAGETAWLAGRVIEAPDSDFEHRVLWA